MVFFVQNDIHHALAVGAERTELADAFDLLRAEDLAWMGVQQFVQRTVQHAGNGCDRLPGGVLIFSRKQFLHRAVRDAGLLGDADAGKIAHLADLIELSNVHKFLLVPQYLPFMVSKYYLKR